jgi:hypothetical protein
MKSKKKFYVTSTITKLTNEILIEAKEVGTNELLVAMTGDSWASLIDNVRNVAEKSGYEYLGIA